MKRSKSHMIEKEFEARMKQYEKDPRFWVEAIRVHLMEAGAKLNMLGKLLQKQSKGR